MCVLSNVGSWGVYIDECHPRSNQKSGLFMWNSEKSRRNDSLGQSGKKGEIKKKVKRGEMMVKTLSPDSRGSFLHEQKLQEQSSCLLFASF